MLVPIITQTWQQLIRYMNNLYLQHTFMVNIRMAYNVPKMIPFSVWGILKFREMSDQVIECKQKF